jgi:uncharacterized RDD family membrane protein YckC
MASAEYSILTPERVSLQYDVAGVGSRGAALLVDALLQGVVVVLMAVVVLVGAGLLVGTQRAASVLAGAIVVLTAFLAFFAYFPVFEIVWNGRTPGKRLLGLRVIRETGYPLRPVDATIRNLVRLVDFLPAFYALGVLTMLLNRRAKRLGDFAAGTIVVREGARSATPPSWLPADGVPVKVALAAEDATLVRDFLLRRQTLDRPARAALAARLAVALASRYRLALDATEPEAFLERLG